MSFWVAQAVSSYRPPLIQRKDPQKPISHKKDYICDSNVMAFKAGRLTNPGSALGKPSQVTIIGAHD